MASKKIKKPEYRVLSKETRDAFQDVNTYACKLIDDGLTPENVKKLCDAVDKYEDGDQFDESLQFFLDNDVEELGYVVLTKKQEDARQKSLDKANLSCAKLMGENDKLREQIAKLKNKPVLAKAPAKKPNKKTAAKKLPAEGETTDG